MFKDLDRPVAQYRRVLSTWLETPGLSLNEAILVRSLSTALNNSLEEFDQLRRIMVQPAFLPTLRSAAAKAQAAGLLLDWNDYAEAA
ncbi:hypothetical protein [Rhizobium sp. Leaf383]|uniref:hypothetical protein n=1 Tax=Rhizobium sp. Leaf383 TaxID=1736357 RepID=UPI000714434F|nr:hypothetical protein [Rhizobium sp. Leaf383]KQS84332.1 hypothetical protein ASG58_21415 [Rhizobium sp. Leaf383]